MEDNPEDLPIGSKEERAEVSKEFSDRVILDHCFGQSSQMKISLDLIRDTLRDALTADKVHAAKLQFPDLTMESFKGLDGTERERVVKQWWTYSDPMIDWKIRLQALDMVYKLLGTYKAEKLEHSVGTIDDLREQLRQAEEMRGSTGEEDKT